MNLDKIQTSLMAGCQHIADAAKPFGNGFKNLVADTLEKPLFDTNFPIAPAEKTNHIVKESFKLLAKLTLVGSAIYLITISFSVLKVVLIGGVLSSLFFAAAQNEKITSTISAKAHEFWSKVSTNKIEEVPVKKVQVEEVQVEEAQVEEVTEEEEELIQRNKLDEATTKTVANQVDNQPKQTLVLNQKKI